MNEKELEQLQYELYTNLLKYYKEEYKNHYDDNITDMRNSILFLVKMILNTTIYELEPKNQTVEFLLNQIN